MSESLVEKRTFRLCDEITLVADCWGSLGNPPVVLAHGGGQTRHAWGETAKRLAENGWYAITIDQRGHGESSWSPKGDYMVMDYGRDLQLLSDLLFEECQQRPVLVGASLGGLAGIMAEGTSEKQYLSSLGVEESGLDKIIKKSYEVLGLQTYLTAGPKEVRAWTIKKGMRAPQAAGVIHTDFERGFIRAEMVSYEDLVKVGGWKEAKEKGLMRLEGKDYVMQDGDVVEFRFNV